MLRLRRLTAIFWAGCLIACCFMLYVLTDLSFNLPNGRSMGDDLDETKWLNFEYKLKHIESELSQHHAEVGEIKTAVEQFVEKSGMMDDAPDDGDGKGHLQLVEPQSEKRPVLTKIVAEANCSLSRQTIPKVDIQMLSMYEHMTFDDRDGGVWKQGWNIEYDDTQWNKRNKLRVFIIPHSHNDPGWVKTFENYYKSQTQSIFKNMIEKLEEDTKRKFIWAEISFLSLWWTQDATQREQSLFKKFLSTGQLEIVTGGWVMNDEANSHWLAIIQQLTTGHQWLIDNVGVIPRNSWAIDPFGHSSSQAYLLRLSQFENSLIQRVHYRVKKELAQNRQLEFKWRQLWDTNGETEMFTHMMPFYSYDVPHTCGPDPKVCCQFDFRRLPGNGVNCPWGVAPKKITLKNVDDRATMILDQWRKKAQLFRSRVVAVPLGDDFRYDRASEWDAQFNNYDVLISHINRREDLNAEVQFGTLHDYFKALRSEMKMADFPTLSGDFFTYADRNQHYWSGYFTSRPFYKNMERALLAYVRAAEMITAQATGINVVTDIMSLQLRDRVEPARRYLSLFQHHDGITGTSRDEVTSDYANKMHTAIKYCQSAIQQSAFYLLGQPTIHGQTQDDVYMEVDDVRHHASDLSGRITIALDVLAASRRIVLYNALGFTRHELITLVVSSHLVQVFNTQGKPIPCQISPVVQIGPFVDRSSGLDVAPNKFHLTFLVTVQPMALTTYTVSLTDTSTTNKLMTYAKLRIYNADFLKVELPKVFAVELISGQHESDLSVRAGDGPRAVLTHNGLMKAIVGRDDVVTPVHMDIVQYGTQRTSDNNSGAYLFIPDGAARVVAPTAYPEMAVVEGELKSVFYTAHPQLSFMISLKNNPTQPQTEVELTSTVAISQADDVELALRFSTNIQNADEFYTDLNGMQMIKRRYLSSLPLQANFYPLPAAAYIEDRNTRLTVLTSTPLGVAALQPGQIEVMQDRRLTRDDNRGMGQGLTQNPPTRHTFRLVVEMANPGCKEGASPGQMWGALTAAAHVTSHTLLQPLVVMHYSGGDSAEHLSYAPVKTPPGIDTIVASYRSHLIGQTKDAEIIQGSGITYQRVFLDLCHGDQTILQHYPLGDGKVKTSEILALRPDNYFFTSSLTYVHVSEPIARGEINLCPMQIRSVFINQTLFSRHRQ